MMATYMKKPDIGLYQKAERCWLSINHFSTVSDFHKLQARRAFMNYRLEWTIKSKYKLSRRKSELSQVL